MRCTILPLVDPEGKSETYYARMKIITTSRSTGQYILQYITELYSTAHYWKYFLPAAEEVPNECPKRY
jgi:hypothetical protein